MEPPQLLEIYKNNLQMVRIFNLKENKISQNIEITAPYIFINTSLLILDDYSIIQFCKIERIGQLLKDSKPISFDYLPKPDSYDSTDLEGRSNYIRTLEDTKYLVSLAHDKKVRIWNIVGKSFVLIKILEPQGDEESIHSILCRGKSEVIIGTQAKIIIYNIDQDKEVTIIQANIGIFVFPDSSIGSYLHDIYQFREQERENKLTRYYDHTINLIISNAQGFYILQKNERDDIDVYNTSDETTIQLKTSLKLKGDIIALKHVTGVIILLSLHNKELHLKFTVLIDLKSLKIVKRYDFVIVNCLRIYEGILLFPLRELGENNQCILINNELKTIKQVDITADMVDTTTTVKMIPFSKRERDKLIKKCEDMLEPYLILNMRRIVSRFLA